MSNQIVSKIKTGTADRKKRQPLVKRFEGPIDQNPTALSQPAEFQIFSRQHNGLVTVTARWERITPEYARFVWNNLNKTNRNVRRSQVRLMQESIREGEFIPTGQTIIFDAEGDLQDGQHRIYAVASAGKSIDALVVRGAPAANFTKLDIGTVRGAADTLQVRGIRNPIVVAAVVRNVKQFEASRTVSRRGVRLSNDEVLRYVNQHQEIQVSVDYVVQSMQRKHGLVGITESQVAFVHYITSGYDKFAADEFVRLLTGPASDLRFVEQGAVVYKEPVKHLRDRLAQLVESKRRSQSASDLSESQVIGLALAAWNLYAKIGRRLSKKLQVAKAVDTGKVNSFGKPITRHGLPNKIATPGQGVVKAIMAARADDEENRQRREKSLGLAPIFGDLVDDDDDVEVLA